MTVQSLLTVVVGWSVTDDHSFPNMCARKDGDTGPSVSCTPASSFNPPMVERGRSSWFLISQSHISHTSQGLGEKGEEQLISCLPAFSCLPILKFGGVKGEGQLTSCLPASSCSHHPDPGGVKWEGQLTLTLMSLDIDILLLIVL